LAISSWAGGIPDLLEWATIGVISFITIMTVYEYLVRRWNVMRFLFGMKPLPPRPAEEAMQPRFGGAARARQMLQQLRATCGSGGLFPLTAGTHSPVWRQAWCKPLINSG